MVLPQRECFVLESLLGDGSKLSQEIGSSHYFSRISVTDIWGSKTWKYMIMEVIAKSIISDSQQDLKEVS